MSLFKRLLNKGEGDARSPGTPPAGMQPMGIQLQRRFAKGVQYNMKIIIRGDKNVGKSCLFYRLQGQKFKEEYIPTDEIQVASIQWNYKATDDVVKVEVWDVVDKGRKRRKLDGLKLDTASDSANQEEPCLDAEFLDVYKGTHGVVFVFDITKQWTFSYVEKEIEKVPPQLPILVLGNHRDMGHHRTVTVERAQFFVDHYASTRTEGAGKVRYAESSMRNGFGLKYLHMFFNLPFLQLQRETLLKQLETNLNDMASTVQELEIHEDSEEQNYELFLESLKKKKKDGEKSPDTPQPSGATNQEKSVPSTATSPTIPEKDAAKNGALVKGVPPSTTSQPPTPTPTDTSSRLPSTDGASAASGVAVATSQQSGETTAPTQQAEGQKAGIFSRLFRGSKSSSVTPPKTLDLSSKDSPQEGVKSVDDFVPDMDGLDNGFLDDAKEPAGIGKEGGKEMDSDSEEEGGNPMVAGFQDDLDSDDDLATSAPVSHVTVARQDSSSEEEVHVQRPKVAVAQSVSSDSEEELVSNPVVTQDADFASSDDEVIASKKKSSVPLASKTLSSSSQAKSKKISGLEVELTDSEEEEKLSSKLVVKNSESAKSNPNFSKHSNPDTLGSSHTTSMSTTASVSVPRDGVINGDVKEGDEIEEDKAKTVDIPELPKEQLDSWLDQFETKVFVSEQAPHRPKKSAKSKPSKPSGPVTAVDSDGQPEDEEEDDSDGPVHVKKVSSDIEEGVPEQAVSKKKKKKKSSAKEAEVSEKKPKKKKEKGGGDSGTKEERKKEKTTKDGEGKKKKKKKKTTTGEEKDVTVREDNDLEAFLESPGGDYETL